MAPEAGSADSSRVTNAGPLESWFDDAIAEFGDAASQVGPGPDCSLRIARLRRPPELRRRGAGADHPARVAASAHGRRARARPRRPPLVLAPDRIGPEAAAVGSGRLPRARQHAGLARRAIHAQLRPPDRHLQRGRHRSAAAPCIGPATPERSPITLPPPRCTGCCRDGCGPAARTCCTPPRSATATEALLLAGRSGSGKSTTAMLAFDSDLLYAGDDFALVREGPEPRVFGLYSSAKLNRDGLERMPALWPHVSNPSRLEIEKALVYLDGSDEVDPARPGAAAGDRAPPCCRSRGHGRDTGQRARRLPRDRLPIPRSRSSATAGICWPRSATSSTGVPCYELALGRDPEGVRAALRELLGAATP